MYVETHSLTKRYGSFTALRDFTFHVDQGEVVGLLGPNGAGKTTLLRTLLGYLRPTSGTATIDGLDCYRQSLAVHRRVSYLPGEARLFRTMRCREVIDFFTSVRRDGSRKRAEQLAVERFGLDLVCPVAAMSTGMRQKLALAVTLAVDTALVILDEPTSNLDPTVRGDVGALVAEAKAAGRTVIFTSHVISEVEQVCDRVLILRAGTLVHTQTIGELRRKHRIRAQLTGAAGAIARVVQRARVRLAWPERRLDDRDARRVVGPVRLAGHFALGRGANRTGRIAGLVRSVSQWAVTPGQ